jgi:hypothetical protein
MTEPQAPLAADPLGATVRVARARPAGIVAPDEGTEDAGG